MVTSTSFQLPKDGTIYTRSIFRRCQDLIRHEIWSGIELNRLDTWIANFKTDEERYFSARVLDALIYRSDRQTIALMKQLFQRVIPDLARSRGLNSSLRVVYQSLQDHTVGPGVRVVPVIPPGESPTKSGTTIARMLRRNLRFHEAWFAYPHDVANLINQVDGIIFVDDFLGTGTQFLRDFLVPTGLASHLSSGRFVYTPLVGHVEGVNRLRTDCPDLHVDTVELLDDSHALFHKESGGFPDDVNSTETARDFYYALLKNRRIDINGPERRGFGHFELAYAFEHAVPDNSLPILWWPHSEDWRPLFDR